MAGTFFIQYLIDQVTSEQQKPLRPRLTPTTTWDWEENYVQATIDELRSEVEHLKTQIVESRREFATILKYWKTNQIIANKVEEVLFGCIDNVMEQAAQHGIQLDIHGMCSPSIRIMEKTSEMIALLHKLYEQGFYFDYETVGPVGSDVLEYLDRCVEQLRHLTNSRAEERTPSHDDAGPVPTGSSLP